MKKVLSLPVLLFAFTAFVLSFSFSLQTPAFSAETMKMSTTTSTRDSGLLDVLLPEFTKDTGIEVQVIAKGTGAALKDGEDGNVDVLFVHDPAREKTFVEKGFGTKRYLVMHNDFVLVGAPKDAAGVKNSKTVNEALEKIVKAKAPFVSRGDSSGTHAKEMALWKNAGIAPDEKGGWYFSIGQGMGKTLMFAEEKQGYALTDRGTYIQQKFGKTVPTELEIVLEGQEDLLNYYAVIPVNPKMHAHAKIALAEKFAEWLVSPKGQDMIANYKLQGQQLFFPDALPKK